MEFFNVIRLLIVMFFFVNSTDVTEKQRCVSPQYLVFGERQIINCSFPEGFFGVYWYNSTNTVEEYPVLHFQESQKGGIGYSSGEFDIYPNGSFVINDVSLQHDHAFAVEYLQTKESPGVTSTVLVIVVVKPLYPFPHIQSCENMGKLCLIQQYPNDEVNCSVLRSRPAVKLDWFVWNSKGYNNLSYDEMTSYDGNLYTTSIATRNAFRSFSYLVLLVCKASAQPVMFDDMKSLVMIESSHSDTFKEEPLKLYFELRSVMVLSCHKGEIDYFIWKRTTGASSTLEIILLRIALENNFTRTYTNGFGLQGKNSLFASPVTVRHEGLYSCVFGGAMSEGEILYSIFVYARPVPEYLVVDGCQTQNYCIMDAKPQGTLTCSVKGIRPEVKLEWRTVSEEGSSLITFLKQETSIKQYGDTYDLSLTSVYRVSGLSPSVVTVQCGVAESPVMILNLTTTIHLIVKQDVSAETDETNSGVLASISILLAFILAIVLIAVFIRAVIYRKVRRNKINRVEDEEENNDEEMPMVATVRRRDDLKEQKAQFIKQLKDNYKEQYNAIQPIPFQKTVFCVNKVFVESGIELLANTSTNNEVWEKAESFRDLFQDSRLESKRVILEGDPGYGKSILTVQLSHDWCNPTPKSYLENLEVLIIIRLRQVGGVKSFFVAIKKLLLPQETHLDEVDIKNILSSSDSLLIVLDGYDEYPDKGKVTDFLQIINNRMFRNCDVILTTRTSYLPKPLIPLTRRARLTGFDERNQEEYIRKTSIFDQAKSLERMKDLRKHPTLLSVCQVPLFFVMIVHMAKMEDNPFQFNSVTEFFSSIIKGLLSHIENKTKYSDQHQNIKIDKEDYLNLDKVAFTGLSGDGQQIVWDKKKMTESIGERTYDLYIQIGILIEEEVLQSVEANVIFGLPNVRTKTQVRFYHKLFCEWYAAQYFAQVVANTSFLNLKRVYKKLNPLDLHYLYRFACGVNRKAAGRIIKYLRNIDECSNFATLCILEQSGDVDEIEDSIIKLCNEGVIISSTDSLILQMSSLQLLELASRKKISIKYVGLHNCIMSVVSSANTILLNSGLRLSSNLPIETLDIFLANREMKYEEGVNLLKIASECSTIKDLWFTGCVPPFSFNVNCLSSAPKAESIKVHWRLFTDSPVYLLNLVTGKWETKKEELHEMGEADYKVMRQHFTQYMKFADNQHQKTLVKEMRQNMRKWSKMDNRRESEEGGT